MATDIIGLGDFHLSVPTDPEGNRAYRKDLARRTAGDLGLRRALIEVCRRDILFYINSFVYQYNPTKKGDQSAGPFICWPFQADSLVATPETHGKGGFLWCYANNRSAVLEKSREMGATWLFLILQDWLCMFHENVQCMDISHNQDAVDSKSKDSLFSKVRFMHRHLPEWLSGEIVEQELYFGFERSDSEITGYASTSRAGVGGRASLIFVDEVSKIREAREVRQKTASTGYCRFFNSTHEGIGTEFYELTRTREMVQWQWHWTEHPEKKPGRYWFNPKTKLPENLDQDYVFPPDYPYVLDGTPTGGPHPGVRSPWYDQKAIEIGSKLGVAVELDINPEGSVEQVFDAILIRNLLAECRPPQFRGNLVYDPDVGTIEKLEPREKGPFKMWCKLDAYGKPPKAPYFIGSDVSNGQGATPTCISVFNGQTGEKVAGLTDPFCDPIQAALIMVGLGNFFLDDHGHVARLIWELIGPGFKMGEKIVELCYGNIYMRTDDMRLDKKQGLTPGWVPTKANKFRLIMDYREGLRTRAIMNPDEEALRETRQFRWMAGEPVHELEDTDDDAAARASHGDHVIADGLAWKEAKRICGEGQQVARRKEETPITPLLSQEGRRQWRENQERREESLQGAWWR